ncbi:hypothetical protein BD289DRAFT_166834 [Coniella lustricola]|uniref:Uncharacterized protein n=1 Tax=Coniella lustricola TaxID=2025994 RepID=A0A2T3AE49_9PEZI|nr:hypothetical protein BD289DRAFT_166834 [Coniella lustricola]
MTGEKQKRRKEQRRPKLRSWDCVVCSKAGFSHGPPEDELRLKRSNSNTTEYQSSKSVFSSRRLSTCVLHQASGWLPAGRGSTNAGRCVCVWRSTRTEKPLVEPETQYCGVCLWDRSRNSEAEARAVALARGCSTADGPVPCRRTCLSARLHIDRRPRGACPKGPGASEQVPSTGIFDKMDIVLGCLLKRIFDFECLESRHVSQLCLALQ